MTAMDRPTPEQVDAALARVELHAMNASTTDVIVLAAEVRALRDVQDIAVLLRHYLGAMAARLDLPDQARRVTVMADLGEIESVGEGVLATLEARQAELDRALTRKEFAGEDAAWDPVVEPATGQVWRHKGDERQGILRDMMIESVDIGYVHVRGVLSGRRSRIRRGTGRRTGPSGYRLLTPAGGVK